jgi:TPP-dependent pyruvate/acetoin dehydrogenase alpha subunit
LKEDWAVSDRFELLRLLLTARRFDEAVMRLQPELEGHHHVSQGLEASAAALALVRRQGDLVASNYRNHAHLVCLGHDPATMLGEILGRRIRPQVGRSGSMHLAAPRLGVLYTSAMVAGGIPQAVGYGLALKRTGSGGVAICFFGDGAVQEGVTHESLNLAALWELPVVFVCENNATPVDGKANAAQAAPSLSALAEAHSIESRVVDGRDARAVLDVLRAATDRVRSALRPRFLDVQSAPWPGNSFFYPKDVTGPTDLRRAEAPTGEDWDDRDDPVLNEARALLADGASIDGLLEVEAEVSRRIEQAVGEARTIAEAGPPAEVARLGVWA